MLAAKYRPVNDQIIADPRSHEVEQRRALDYLVEWKYNPDKPDVEAAWAFAVRIMQSFAGGFPG